jgi:hypothetical protein
MIRKLKPILLQIWIIYINLLIYIMKNLRMLVAVFVSAILIIMMMSCGASKKASCPAYGQVETEEKV